MSSLPLISHHLFVAAVKSKARARRPARAERHLVAAKVPVFDFPLELIDFGRPAPLETAWPFGAVSRSGSS